MVLRRSPSCSLTACLLPALWLAGCAGAPGAERRPPALAAATAPAVACPADPADLRAENLTVSNLADSAGEDGAAIRGCTLLVGAEPAEVQGRAHAIARRTVSSVRQTALRRRVNPEWKAAREALRDAEQEGDAGGKGSGLGSAAKGDPTMGLIGLALSGAVRGVGALLDWRERSVARDRLEGLPHFLEEPVLEPYDVTVETVRVERDATLHLALVDPSSGSLREARLPVRHAEQVEVARDMDPADRKLAGPTAEAEPPLTVERLRQLLRQAPPARGVIGSAAFVEALRSAPMRPFDPAAMRLARAAAAPALAADGPRAARSADAAATVANHPSVVAVAGAAGRGFGFYVGPESVLTARDLIGDTTLVAIEPGDGRRLYAILDREDEALGVALLHVQRSGPPVTLDAGPDDGGMSGADARPRPGDLPGTPIFQGERLVGMVAPGALAGWLDAEALAGLVRRWQVPSASPGPWPPPALASGTNGPPPRAGEG